MITFNDFIKKYNLRNKATSNIKSQQVFSSLSLDDVGIFLRDGPIEKNSWNIGIVNLHPSKGSHWILNINDNYFDSYGCAPPKKLSKIKKKEMGIVYILNIKYKKMIVLVQVIV